MWRIMWPLPFFGLFGCGMDCNNLYAWDTLYIEFEPTIDGEGVWVFNLSDGFDAVCEVTLPASDTGVNPVESCEEVTHLELTPNDRGVEYLMILAAPEAFRLLITRDSAVVFDKTIKPAYDVSECSETSVGTVYVEVPES